MEEKNNKNSLFKLIKKEWLLLLFLFLLLSGVRQVFGLILIIILLIKTRFNFTTDRSFYLLVFFSFLYAVITTVHGLNENPAIQLIMYSLYPPFFYILGRYLMDKWQTHSYFLIIFVVVSLALPGIIEVFQDIISNGFISVTRNIELDEEKDYASTLRGAKVSLGVASFALILSPVVNLKEKIYKLLLSIIGIISVMTVMHQLSRTGIVITLVTLLSVALFNFHYYSKKKIIIVLLLLLSAGYVLSPVFKEFKAVEAYLDREDQHEGFEAKTAGGRFERWTDGLNALFTKPFGGGVFRDGERFYAHNTWLDVAEMGGILPFLALMVLTVINLKKSYAIIRYSAYLPRFLVNLILVINIGFFLTCFVEPMFEGNFIYVSLYFCFWGMISVLYRDDKQYTQSLPNNI